MPRQLLPHDVTPEDRARGCLWASVFRSAPDEVAKRGTLGGTPTIDHGVTLNGTDQWIEYALNDQFLNVDPLSFHIIFRPDFAAGEAVNRNLIGTVPVAEISLGKDLTSELFLFLGATLIFTVDATATWVQNARNVITVSATSGATDVWHNGVQIVTADATAWSLTTTITELHVGQTGNDLNRFDGQVDLLKMYNVLLTEQEHLDVLYPGGN